MTKLVALHRGGRDKAVDLAVESIDAHHNEPLNACQTETNHDLVAKPSISNWLSTSKSQTDLPFQSSNSTVVNENNDEGDEESDVSDRSVSEGDFETSDEVDISETPAQSVSSTNIPLSILLDIQRSVKRLDKKKNDKMEKAMKHLEKENKTLKEQNAMLAENVNDLKEKMVSLERSNSDFIKNM